MSAIGYSIVDIETGEKIAHGNSPEIVVELPVDGGMAHFSEVGQIEPEHAPRYKCVERVLVSQEPAFPFTVESEAEIFVDDRIEITRQYVPDQGAYQRAIEAKIEAVAAERGYSSAVSAASYVASTVPQWASEATAFVAWRDSVWGAVYAILADVQGGNRQPPSIAELIAELPTAEWPV